MFGVGFGRACSPPFQVKYSAADKSKWDVVVPDEVGGPIATKFEVNFGYTFDP
jgi:hypothetical protein